MSKKYVDVDEMKKRILCNDPELPDYKILMTFIDNLPAADVAPVVHAEWKYNGANYKCTNCGTTDRYGNTLYCPKCGAKMDEEVTSKKEYDGRA